MPLLWDVAAIFFSLIAVRGGADKSLARSGRKQATATKLVFNQHTPHEAEYTSWLVALNLDAAQKIQKFVRPTRSPRQQ